MKYIPDPIKPISCWGRNGRFMLSEVNMIRFPFNKDIMIDFVSKRRGKHAPMSLVGTIDQVRELANFLLNAIEEE